VTDSFSQSVDDFIPKILCQTSFIPEIRRTSHDGNGNRTAKLAKFVFILYGPSFLLHNISKPGERNPTNVQVMLFHRLNPCVALWTMMATTMMILSSNTRCSYVRAFHLQAQSRHRSFRRISSSSSLPSSSADLTSKSDKGKLLILGGTGFVGQTLCKRASLEGYSVTSLSRRGLPSPEGVTKSAPGGIDYRMGDASNIESITDLLDEGGYVGKFVRGS
jgi:hypothetical protein